MNVLLAIPCYNCAPQISRTLKALSPQLLAQIKSVVVIDNRSLDTTTQVAIDTLKSMNTGMASVFRNRDNIGLGGSHKVAFRLAQDLQCDYVAILHGDDQAQAQELALLLEKATQNPKADAILGSRFMVGSKRHGYSKIRTIGNMLLNLIYSLVTLRPTYDLGSGLNLFSIRAFSNSDFLKYSNVMTFNVDLLLDFYRRNRQVIFTPITWSESDQKSNARSVEVGLGMLKALLKWRFGFKQKSVAGYYLSEIVWSDRPAP